MTNERARTHDRNLLSASIRQKRKSKTRPVDYFIYLIGFLLALLGFFSIIEELTK